MNLEKIIYDLECSHIQPEVRTSAERLEEVLAEEFYEFGSSGRVWTRDDYKEEHQLDPDKMRLTHFTMHVLGPAAVLTTYQIYNETRNRKTLRSSVWRRTDGKWQLFFHQGTPTEE